MVPAPGTGWGPGVGSFNVREGVRVSGDHRNREQGTRYRAMGDEEVSCVVQIGDSRILIMLYRIT